MRGLSGFGFMNGEVSKKRNANMDLLRMLSMIMVTMLHALGKSGLLLPLGVDLPLNGWVAWVLECLSISAVNIFMLLSGYYLIQTEFKGRRLFEILFQVFFYSAGTYLVYWWAGWLTEEQSTIYYMLQSYLPVHMDVYWFITAYVVLYLFQPILSKGVQAVSQRTLRNVILGMLIYDCLVKSLLPFRMETDARGYSFLWYLIVFMAGAYVRLYGFPMIKKAWQGWLLYLGGTALILLETFCLQFLYARTGRLGDMLLVATDYNHAFVFLSSFGIFLAFLQGKPMEGKMGKVISALSPMTLGVYLFQESILLRYEWQKWFALPGSIEAPLPRFIGKLLAAVLGMFVLGIGLDFVRFHLFRMLTKIFMGKRSAGREGD